MSDSLEPSLPETCRARYWHRISPTRIACDLCPRACRLKDGQRGFCYVRQNRGMEMSLTTYGRSSGFCIDPIEKKPLNHFFPGSSVLSFGTAGCNLGCKFCQNWDISKSKSMDRLAARALPDEIARAAQEAGCKSVAYTYNDPVIFAEYAIDTARACHQRDIQNVAVTAGYISPGAREEFFADMDAANIDLKSFSPEFYKKLTYGDLDAVLDTLMYVHRETDIWLEITTLLIPGHNDDDEELHRMTEWIVSHLGPDVPVHFSAFHPDFRMIDTPPTPKETLLRACKIAQSQGIHFVYVGNVHDSAADSTYCAKCGALLVQRDWYRIGAYRLDPSGKCPKCGAPCPGRFDTSKGSWGARRQVLAF